MHHYYYLETLEVQIEEVWLPNIKTFEVYLSVSSGISSKIENFDFNKIIFYLIFIKVTWFENTNKKLSTYEWISIKCHKSKYVMKIENIHRSEGYWKYKCKATNYLGTAEEKIDVTGLFFLGKWLPQQLKFSKSSSSPNILWRPKTNIVQYEGPQHYMEYTV